MELNGERVLPVSQERAWAALNDVDLLQRCIPGCESLTRAAEGSYQAVVNVAIGPVRARFTGSFTLTDIDVPSAYTLRFEGNAGATGFARGQARVTLAGEGAQLTRLRYATSAQVGGKLAQIGSRLVDAAAGAMADKFFASFAQQLAPPAPGGPVPRASPSGLGFWGLVRAFLRRLFR